MCAVWNTTRRATFEPSAASKQRCVVEGCTLEAGVRLCARGCCIAAAHTRGSIMPALPLVSPHLAATIATVAAHLLPPPLQTIAGGIAKSSTFAAYPALFMFGELRMQQGGALLANSVLACILSLRLPAFLPVLKSAF